MTEFEIASLAIQKTGLAIAAVSAIAAAIAASGIWWGIAAMMRANKERAAFLDQQREADERRHAEAMEEGRQRHLETMAALDQQREADERRHAEAMEEGRQRHLETMAALAEQSRTLESVIRGLETVIERTAPRESE